MMYFVPSWYHGNEYKENEQYWYRRRTVTEFDDSVKQVQMFNRNNIMDYKILNLSYCPNFRHFLHRQSVFHAPYWSIHHFVLWRMFIMKSMQKYILGKMEI